LNHEGHEEHEEEIVGAERRKETFVSFVPYVVNLL
jgi:hypothetical protein